jgi:hypothetical protein
MDVFGIFYELPMMTWGGHVWGIKPISYHLRIVPDFCFWRGMLVLGGDQTDHGVGQPQSGLLFQNIDDLWGYGKPTGWGAVWQEDTVKAREVSDPFLMNGFDKKALHLMSHHNINSIIIEIDFLGNGEWYEYKRIDLLKNTYEQFIFPEGFSAQWVRLRTTTGGVFTAQFVYN